MSQAVQKGAVLYRLQWSNGKVRKERYFANKENARQVYGIVVDALPGEDWCRLSEMEDQGINGYVEIKVLEYSEE